MARKLKYSEPTDVVSVRLPISRISQLDDLCRSLGIDRAEFIIAVLRRYPEMPKPERAKIWLANLTWLLIGGGAALLASLYGGSTTTAERMAPARALTREPIHIEAGTAGQEAPRLVPPLVPLRDLRTDKAWRLGNLQSIIPRYAAQPSEGVEKQQATPEKEKSRSDIRRAP